MGSVVELKELIRLKLVSAFNRHADDKLFKDLGDAYNVINVCNSHSLNSNRQTLTKQTKTLTKHYFVFRSIRSVRII